MIYILRFIAEGGGNVDCLFRDEQKAMHWYRKAKECIQKPGLLELVDDFGVAVLLRPERYAVVVTNSKSSATLARDLEIANSQALRDAGVIRGSTH